MMHHLRHTLLLALSLTLTVICGAETTQRILFIGNSYTAGVRTALQQTLNATEASELQFITKGGATLEQHLNTPATIQTITEGQWTFVVLQEQSQTPALGGQYTASFNQSVDQLSQIIKDAGATPVLYATWGRRDGDSRNQALFPDFGTMNAKLTSAYQQAATRNEALLVPVCQTWAAVKKKDEALWKKLYKKDGSHPSAVGAYLTAYVFSQQLNPHAETKQAPAPTALTQSEQALLQQVARTTMRK